MLDAFLQANLTDTLHQERLLHAAEARRWRRHKRSPARKFVRKPAPIRLPRMRNIIQRLFGAGLVVRKVGAR